MATIPIPESYVSPNNNIIIVQEAPIVHGTISVNNLTVSTSIQFANGSVISDIDNTLDKNSTNPLSNSSITSAINNIVSPPVENFNIHLVMNPSASHTTGVVVFPTLNTNINDFASGGPDQFNSSITVPVSGTYSVFFKTTAYDSDDTLSANLTVNGQAFTPSLGTQSLTYSSTISLSASSEISLYCNTSVPARSELLVCLLKKDQTLTSFS